MTDDPPVLSFDLTERPWIPVLNRDRDERELSLREVLAQAPELLRVSAELPTQEFALVRLLLAILHDALDAPADAEDWAELWEGGLPSEKVAGYLDEHRQRFDLLHQTTPFFQVAGLRNSTGEVFSLNRIVADVPAGAPFFTQRERGVDRLTFAEAARWLVHAHAYDAAGIKTGAVGDPRAKGGKGYPQGVGWAGQLGGVLVEGNSLAETLLLNLVGDERLRTTDGDRPAWRFPPSTAAPLEGEEKVIRPYGVRDLYTWQSRRVRLHADERGVHGVVLSYGDPLAPHNMHEREPMSAWRRSANQEKKLRQAQVFMPQEHDPTRSAWRGLASLIATKGSETSQSSTGQERVMPRVLEWIADLTEGGHLDPDHLVRLRLAGVVYGTQQSVIDEVLGDALPMHLVLLHPQDTGLANAAIAAGNDADAAVRAIGRLANNLARAVGADPEGPRAAARDHAAGVLEGRYRAWLHTLRPGAAPEDRRSAWRQTVRDVIAAMGEELVDQAGETAWTGRLIETSNGELWLNSAFAQRRFRSDLNYVLSDNTSGEAAA